MSKGNETVEQKEKVKTKYDLKMEARRKAEEKERKVQKITKVVGILLCVAIVGGIISGIGLSIYNKQQALNGTYIELGDHAVNQLEYDYYYNTMLNNYEQMYSSYLGLMGLDLNKDLSQQDYSEVMTWKDFFDRMTVNQLRQVKALSDEAKAQGFAYDDTEEYQLFLDSLAAGAEAEAITEAQYCKNTYGKYATVDNLTPFVKENLLAAAYYTELETQNAPTEQEVSDYYTEHKQEYDTVDYRVLPFTADVAEDATEDEINDALVTLAKNAEEMRAEIEAGGDFKELCKEYAQEAIKADYEDAEADPSLQDNAFYAQTTEAYSDWLFDEARKEGEVNVVLYPENRECYVVQFLAREYDETTNDTISNLLASERATEIVNGLEEAYTIVNTAGKLEYLDKEEVQLAAEAAQESETQTEGTEAADETGTQESSAAE